MAEDKIIQIEEMIEEATIETILTIDWSRIEEVTMVATTEIEMTVIEITTKEVITVEMTTEKMDIRTATKIKTIVLKLQPDPHSVMLQANPWWLSL